MKILYKYILKQVMSVFAVCLVVFTFVLFIGNLLRIIDMMSKGISGAVIVKFLILLIPFMLSYSIPISILTAVLLVFSRLSADNEITAIRASGINLKYIFRQVILCAVIAGGLCYFINDRLRPHSIFAGRKLLIETGIENPILYVKSGRFNEIFPGYVIYTGEKKGNKLKRVVVYKFKDEKLSNIITAENGEFVSAKGKDKKGSLFLRLNSGSIDDIPQEGQSAGKLNRINFNTYVIELDIKKQISGIYNIPRKDREMTNAELAERIKKLRNREHQPEYKNIVRELEEEISSIKTRRQNRISLSFSCIAFILTAIPLGIKVQRQETSIGAGVSLILVTMYYFLLTLGQAFQRVPRYYPWVFVWLPDLILIIIGCILINRLLKK